MPVTLGGYQGRGRLCITKPNPLHSHIFSNKISYIKTVTFTVKHLSCSWKLPTVRNKMVCLVKINQTGLKAITHTVGAFYQAKGWESTYKAESKVVYFAQD